MSKHSDDENDNFHFLTNLVLCRTLILTILNAFQSIAYLFAVEIESPRRLELEISTVKVSALGYVFRLYATTTSSE